MFDHRRQIVVICNVGVGRLKIQIVGMAIDLGLTRISQNDEFVAQVSADGTGISLHGNGF